MSVEAELPVIRSEYESMAARIPLSLWFAMVYPFILTVFYFVFMNGQDTDSQNTVFSILKLIKPGPAISGISEILILASNDP